jgi:hypothetical protein
MRKKKKFPSSPYHLNSSSVFSREGHLASVIAEETDDWSENDHQDEIERVGYGRVRPSPEDEDDFKNEKKD